ncbi:MAG: citramalate synthase [Spirochaetes bacterium]|nr:citramalate synthase [Spirochaetota bacterium]
MSAKKDIFIFDSTLRDGAQSEGISFSVKDKINIVEALDYIGVKYIEAGNPGSNPKDLEFFSEARNIHLKNARLTAFGSTRRRDIKPEDDANVQSLLLAETPAVSIFGKSWDFHVTDIIKTTKDENLKMIKDTIAFFKSSGKEVIFDAEHFFDGYKNNPEYALKTLEAALEGGADSLCLCDTNGGSFPDDVFNTTKLVCNKFSGSIIGIHAHDDGGMAVANSILAVSAGAKQVQGTFIGFGERCGNANLSAIIPNLQLKRGYNCIPDNTISHLTKTSRRIASIANIILQDSLPFVGMRAFTHKAGMHIDGVNKASKSFEHLDPELIGNERRFLMSEVAGRSSVLQKIQLIDPDINKDSPETKEILDRLKELEHEGYQFEGAENSFELVIKRHLKKYKPFFELEHFKIIGEQPAINREISSSALVKVRVGNETAINAAEGDGPVNALDKALRKSLDGFFPQLKNVKLTDYKVRVLDTKDATAAKVRVIIESTDGENIWNTVGVSTDIIEASWKALVDSIEYKLLI